jgi:hypothetical protein
VPPWARTISLQIASPSPEPSLPWSPTCTNF